MMTPAEVTRMIEDLTWLDLDDDTITALVEAASRGGE